MCILRNNFLSVNLDAGKGGHVCAIALAPSSKADVQGSHCQNLNQISLSAGFDLVLDFIGDSSLVFFFYVVSLIYVHYFMRGFRYKDTWIMM